MEYNGIMPSVPIDYSKIIMYRIYSKSCDFTYVGHTINTTRRKAEHKRHCEKEHDPKHNIPIYKQIRENGGWDSFIFAEIEEYPCENAVQARIREQYWIDHYKANLNSTSAYKSPEERKEYEKEHRKAVYEENKVEILINRKEYRDSHKEQIKQYRKDNKDKIKKLKQQWHEENKERISTERKQKMTCECGTIMCVREKWSHAKTKKHIQFMESKA